MYILICIILLLIVIYFWQNIITLLKILKTGELDSKTGYLWFFTLLVINITIIIFIYGFYYYKINQPGKTGANGPIGLAGQHGNDGFIEIPCYRDNKP